LLYHFFTIFKVSRPEAYETQARNQGCAGGAKPPRVIFVLLGKCLGHNLKLLDTVQKNVGPSQKTLRVPG